MDIDDSRYDIYELDDGNLYVVENLTGDIFRIDFQNQIEQEKEDWEDLTEEITELSDGYEDINDGIEKLKVDMHDWGSKRGVVFEKETRKEKFTRFKKRKNKLKLRKDLEEEEEEPEVEEDIFSDPEITKSKEEYEKKKKMYLSDNTDFHLDFKTKEKILSETSSKPKYNLEC